MSAGTESLFQATHELKCWPPFFESVREGRKPFEVRRNDRGFNAGDRIRLREWDPDRNYGSGAYTGNDVWLDVTYVLSGFEGVEDGYVVMGVREMDE